MITLDLKDYCQYGCMNFKASTEGGVERTVKCANARQCEYLVRYLKHYAVENSQKN